MKLDVADLFLYGIIGGLFFFAAGVVARSPVVSVVGLLFIVGLVGIIVVFANKEFQWVKKSSYTRPDVVYVDRPICQAAPAREVSRYPSEPGGVYQDSLYDESEDPEDPEDPKDPEDPEYHGLMSRKKYKDPFADLDVLDNWHLLD